MGNRAIASCRESSQQRELAQNMPSSLALEGRGIRERLRHGWHCISGWCFDICPEQGTCDDVYIGRKSTYPCRRLCQKHSHAVTKNHEAATNQAASSCNDCVTSNCVQI